MKYELENNNLCRPVQSQSDECIMPADVNIKEKHAAPAFRPPRFSNDCSTICWLNAILQLLFITMDDCIESSSIRNVINAYRSTNTNTINSATELRGLLSEKLPYLRTGYQDPFDFFTALSHFSENEQMSVVSPLILRMTSKVSCIHNEHHFNERNEDPEYYIGVNVPQSYQGLQLAIEQCVTYTESLPDWRCESCEFYGGIRLKQFKDAHMPKYMIIKLNRALRNEDGNTYKNTNRVKPSALINVKSKESNNHTYMLCGIITHLGSSMDTGHYIAEVRYGKSWLKCNDSTITSTTFESLSNEGYGFLFKKNTIR